MVRMENDLPRAEAVNAQFVEHWPNDPRIPEALLRQGQLYRQMGLNYLALTKFYAVMTAALSLKSDRPEDVYKRQTRPSTASLRRYKSSTTEANSGRACPRFAGWSGSLCRQNMC